MTVQAVEFIGLQPLISIDRGISMILWVSTENSSDLVGGLSSVSSSLSSFLRCLRMRNITPTHTSKVAQSESGVSHEASICSVH